ncbi:N-acetyltransferase [Rhodovulum sp. 12E13]|uniref:GNAT family N-acetyltransferase n=1 Tax=Rhodovulum sp. 12E13 TaxID=2203891 RepID=UPI000E135C87|nr:N-acetyltransferase [Rhodovulum sp. 12E13]RDC74518.1 N-acetyltransferase [Rhodovulum sp. 12E13]
MDLADGAGGREREIVDLFATTFTASEGAEEGALIGRLVRDLLDRTPPDELRVFTASDEGALAGAVIFTRLRYAGDARRVVLLSPMAVGPGWQGRGTGQALIRHALDTLRAEGADVALTYGDPAFYGKVGFGPVTEATAPPPQPLSQPEGWMGQALDGGDIAPLTGPATCAAALDDAAYW